MSKQYKKLQNKLHPQEKAPEKKKQKPVGKDYLLIFIISFTFFVLLVSWNQFDAMKRIMYIALTLALSLTYVSRHAKLSEVQEMWVARGGLVAIAVSVILFFITCYYEFFA